LKLTGFFTSEENQMKWASNALLAMLVIICLAAVIPCQADDASKLAILKSIEGNWNSKIVGQEGKTYIRPWTFRVEGNDFVSTITRPGMSPETGKTPLNEILNEEGVLKVNIPFPPYTHKASLVITTGKITGTAWRQGRNPIPSDIVFERR